MCKTKVWTEVSHIPDKIDNTDTLLFQGHKFIKTTIVDKMSKSQKKKYVLGNKPKKKSKR